MVNCERFVIEGANIVDQCSFIDAMKATFPMDPPLVGNDHWDAFSDSLFGGLDELDAKQVVLVWMNSELMEQKANGDYQIALECLGDVCEILANPQRSNCAKTEFTVLLT